MSSIYAYISGFKHACYICKPISYIELSEKANNEKFEVRIVNSAIECIETISNNSYPEKRYHFQNG